MNLLKLFVIYFFVCFIFTTSLLSQSFFFQPYKEEGYFQGWNYSFINSDFQIFITALVSNLGPGSLHNGVAISIQSLKTGNYFKTKNFKAKDFFALEDNFYIKIQENEFSKVGESFEIKVSLEDIKITLKYENLFLGVPISKGKHTIKKNYFVQADIPFSYSRANGVFEFKGNTYILEGLGGMEHLLTNYEVYKFSKSWEMLRSISKNQTRFFTGGFSAKEKDNDYRMIAIQDKNGKLIFFNKILSSEILLEKKESFSGYILPYKERLFVNKDCAFLVEYLHNVGKINVLESVSIVLRSLIRFFFVNPYILNFSVKVISECPSQFPTSIEWNGIKSDYLLNPK